MKILVPSYKHLIHSALMISWIIFFIYITLEHRAKEDVISTYGTFLTTILVVIRIINLLALPQLLLNFVSLLMFETFPENVKLKCSPQSAPFFMVRVVTRGLYPKLVGKTVSKNLETITSVGCENFGIEGTFSVTAYLKKKSFSLSQFSCSCN